MRAYIIYLFVCVFDVELDVEAVKVKREENTGRGKHIFLVEVFS